jgi:hypothetical protein
LNIQVYPNVSVIFSALVISVVGGGTSTWFWTDGWLHRQSIQDLAPALFGLVPKRAGNRKAVYEAVQELRWVADIRGSLPTQALVEFFLILDDLTRRVGSSPVDPVQYWYQFMQISI